MRYKGVDGTYLGGRLPVVRIDLVGGRSDSGGEEGRGSSSFSYQFRPEGGTLLNLVLSLALFRFAGDSVFVVVESRWSRRRKGVA